MQKLCNGKKKNGIKCTYKAKFEGYCGIHYKTYLKKLEAEQAGECITITFGEVAENHVRMQKIGNKAEYGFNYEDLQKAKVKFEAKGLKCELVNLAKGLTEPEHLDDVNNVDEAYVLVIRNAINLFCDADEMFTEQKELTWDTKALMYGKVCNKKARYNLCFDDVGQESCYKEGKGTIVAFKDVKHINSVREQLPKFLGIKANNLKAEGNRYFNIKECGIGFHGDAERKIVVACRLGKSIPLHYRWFLNCSPVGNTIKLKVNHGDMYVMSEKATGNDWKKKKILTLRHAAGSKKFTTIKTK